jgi:hypothetical protein
MGPSEEVLFRVIDSCHSAIGIDELDKLYINYKKYANVFALLDSGYTRGLPAYRYEVVEGNRKLVSYDGFGLKVFTRTGEISKELLSRSITINMLRNRGFKKLLRDPTPSDFQQIRDAMYAYRLKRWRKVKDSYESIKNKEYLSGRVADIFYPLLTMARIVSKKLFREVLEFAEEEESRRSRIQLDPIDRALLRSLSEDEIEGPTELKEITDIVNTRLLLEGEIDERHAIRSGVIESKLQGFGFMPIPDQKGGKTRYDIDKSRVKLLREIYLK